LIVITVVAALDVDLRKAVTAARDLAHRGAVILIDLVAIITPFGERHD
jgi:hypothetical protein